MRCSWDVIPRLPNVFNSLEPCLSSVQIDLIIFGPEFGQELEFVWVEGVVSVGSQSSNVVGLIWGLQWIEAKVSNS